MNFRLIMLVSFCIFWMSTTFAQEKIKESSADFAFATNGEATSIALFWSRLHGIGASQKLKIGYGARAWAFWGKDLNYSTAPLKLSKDEATTDNFMVGTSSAMAFNAMLHIVYKFNDKWSGGFNIDAIGLGFGSTQKGVFRSDENPTLNGTHKASPTSFNLLLGGDNDIGQIKSEIYMAYAIDDKLKVRAGFDYTFAEYTTNIELAHDNDRFRHKAGMVFIALNRLF